ncbi:MAG: alternative ribosome rescue aminoacyl-tRNA hydrolase ArfB [Rectinema sp.]
MNRERIRASIASAARIDYSRSGGPGGQNVNKVNSKATARITLDEIDGLSERERAHAVERLGSRITVAGELVVAADDERDQPRNRELALSRLAALVEGAAAIPRVRRPTKPTRASRERRLSSKKAHSERKISRSGRGDAGEM